MTTDQAIQTLQKNQFALRHKGLKTLVLIGAASSTVSPSRAMEFLAELEPPYTYAHLLEVRHVLTTLLQHPVDVTLANPRDPAVGDFLDPSAVFILSSPADR